MSDVDQQIEQLTDRIQSLRDQCLSKSASRVARELKSLAKQEGRVVPYLIANFYLMNDAQSLLDPEAGVEAAIESIALLESEDKARKLQPDFPEDEYWQTVAWMSACAYDNLAKHVAEREGYNSDGVHDCITDGMQVCRRTGKLECLTCFREYATDVYRASDDLDMALHHARFVAAHQDPSGNNDRRWVGTKDVTQLLLLAGQLDDAWESAQASAGLTETYHNPLGARRDVARLFETLHWLRGTPDELPAALEAHGLAQVAAEPLPAGENLTDEFQAARVEALAACCQGGPDRAIEIFTRWDKLFKERSCLSHWLEGRLLLIAAYLLKGDRKRAEALGRELETRAQPARDYLSLRRLKALLETSGKPSPIASIAPLSSGPFGQASVSVAVGAAPGETAPPETPPEDSAAPPPTPLGPRIEEFLGRIDEAKGDEALLAGILEDIRSIPAGSITAGEDAAWLLFLSTRLGRWTERVRDAWAWGRSLVDAFPEHAGVLNLTADLAEAVRETCESQEEADAIATDDQMERWFRKSLDLDSESPNNYARAGVWFQSRERVGEAERCFARAFRLARGDARIALNLAEIYADSERPRDALSVLDMCIREGAQEPPLFWHAGMIAYGCERWESVITYLDRYEEVEPDQPWTQYYRAWSLLECNRPAEAVAAIALEEQRNPDSKLAVACLRAWAFAAQGEAKAFRAELRKALAVSLVDNESMTMSGLARLFAKLDDAGTILPPQDPDRRALDDRLLQTGLAPSDYFERCRTAEPEAVNFYVCRLIQEVGPDWRKFPGCLNGQENWTEYEARWGVLAESEEAAAYEALRWQQRCHPGTVRCEEVVEEGGPYEDSPGIVWQASHNPPEPPDEDDEPEEA